jgi:predicted MPP superfamily phosphohydrolase
VVGGAWLALSLGATVLHQYVWDGAGRDSPLKSVGNFLHAVMAPGFLAYRVVVGHWGVRGFWPPFEAAGVATAFWIGSGAIVVWARGAILRRRAATRVAAPGEGGSVARAPGIDLSRRRLIVDGVLSAGLAGTVGPVASATMVGPWRLRVRRYTVEVKDLPLALEGVRLVQISDTHLGARIPLSFLERAVREAIALAPDIFLLTGDYILGGDSRIPEAAGVFEPLVREKVPVVGVLGNHDWYGNGPRMAAELKKVGVVMLDNARMFVNKGKRDLTESTRHAGLCLAGVGDLLTDTVDLGAALGGVPAEVPRVLLSHNPDVAEMPAMRGHRVDLMMSGHTHGGQVALPLVGPLVVPSAYGKKYAGGLVGGPTTRVLISRGVGMSILPVRFNVPPEIVEVMLVRG